MRRVIPLAIPALAVATFAMSISVVDAAYATRTTRKKPTRTSLSTSVVAVTAPTPTPATTSLAVTSAPTTATITTIATTSTKPPTKLVALGATEAMFQRNSHTTEVAIANPNPGATAWSVISTDPSFVEFSKLVRATKLESLFERSDAKFTFLVPTNGAFASLDQMQLARLQTAAYADAAAQIVRQHVALGRATLADFTRRAPYVPNPFSTNAGATTTVTLAPPIGTTSSTTVPYVPAVTVLKTDGGGELAVASSIVAVPGGGDRPRVSVSEAAIEISDFAVGNGVLHTVDSVLLPARLGKSLTDIVGR
jgi:uncharacterized surface protein with fasciclin (FAS1) repeats